MRLLIFQDSLLFNGLRRDIPKMTMGHVVIDWSLLHPGV
jgi:hypothetical protein